MQTARVFTNGNSQAVRLPKQFRLSVDEVFIHKVAQTGDIVLSTRPPAGAWSEFFALRAKTRVPADFLIERELNELALGRDALAAPSGALSAPARAKRSTKR